MLLESTTNNNRTPGGLAGHLYSWWHSASPANRGRSHDIYFSSTPNVILGHLSCWPIATRTRRSGWCIQYASLYGTLQLWIQAHAPGFYPRRGRQLPGGARQHTILPKFPKNCMKLKEFGHPGGRASLASPLRSATAIIRPNFPENYMKIKKIWPRGSAHPNF